MKITSSKANQSNIDNDGDKPRAAVATLMMAGAVHSAMADQLDDIKKAGVVRVAIAVGTPLFSYADKNLQHAGSDVDMAAALAKDLGVKLEPVCGDFDHRGRREERQGEGLCGPRRQDHWPYHSITRLIENAPRGTREGSCRPA